MEDEEIKDHVTAAGLTVITIRSSEKGKLAFYSIPDVQAKKAALDMAYKLKGSYAPEKSISMNLSADVRSLDPKAAQLKEEYERKLLETIQGE